MTYRIAYKIVRPHPAGGTYVTGPYIKNVIASDAQTAKDAITGLNPGAKIVKVRNLDADYDARARRAEAARNR